MGAHDRMLADLAEQYAVEREYRAPGRKAARRRRLFVKRRDRPYRPAAPLPFVEVAEQDRRRKRGLGDQIYDVTAWNIALLYDLEVVPSATPVTTRSTPIARGDARPETGPALAAARVGYMMPWGLGAAEAAVELLRGGVRMHSLPRPVTIAGRAYPAGTVDLKPTGSVLEAIKLVKKGIWNGVYTAAQATRGKTTFDTTCTRCHGADLAGTNGPPLVGDKFFANWETDSLNSLFVKIRDTMPPNSATILEPEAKLDILT